MDLLVRGASRSGRAHPRLVRWVHDLMTYWRESTAWGTEVKDLRGAQTALQRMWNFSLTTRPSRTRQRYQAETSFMGTQRRSSLR